MTPEDIKTRLTIHGLMCRVAQDEVQIKNCVFCGNEKWNLEINAIRGVYSCWACGARGRADAFLQKYTRFEGKIPIQTYVFQKDPRPGVAEYRQVTEDVTARWAISYLEERGVDEVDRGIYNISQGRIGDWIGRVTIVMKEYWTREEAALVGRAALSGIKPKYFADWKGKRVITGFRHNGSCNHVLVEGPFDGIKIHKAGSNAAILSGIEESPGLLEEWAAAVPKDDTIIVMLDGDATDQAHRLYWKIYPIHPRAIVCPLPEGWDPGKIEPDVLRTIIKTVALPCPAHVDAVRT